MAGLERFKLKERVKLSYLKNWGDILKVHEETGLPIDLIRKEIRKIRGKEKHDVSILISHTLMQYMFSRSGYREKQLQDLFDQLKIRSIVTASNCHTAPFRSNQVIQPDGTTATTYTCLRCNQLCFPIETTQNELFDKLITIVSELREEDKTLITFAEKMGYTKISSDNSAVKIEDKRQYLFVNGSRYPAEAPHDVQKALTEAAALSPMDREIIRKSLEKRIYDEEKNDASEVTEEETDEPIQDEQK